MGVSLIAIHWASPVHLNFVLLYPLGFGCHTGPVGFMVPHLPRTIHSSLNNVRISYEIRSFYFYGWFCLIRSKWMDVCIVEFQVRLDPLAIN
jgi:hypothetical protein